MLRYLLLLLLSLLCFSHAEVSQNDADIFFNWLKEKTNFPSPKFKLAPKTKDEVGYLGNVKPIATESIKEGDVLFTFRQEQSFNYENEKSLFSDIVDILHFFHETQIKQESSWAPYINILPTKLTTPIFWTSAEFAELKGTSIYGQTMQLNKTIKIEYEAIVETRNYTTLFPDTLKIALAKSGNEDLSEEDLDEDDVISFSEWRWAYSILRSRNWKTTNGAKIAPILELFNYGEESNVKVVMKDDGSVDLVAENNIHQGENLIINDGMISNRELLDWYGFVVPTNSKDYYPVGVGLDSEEKLYGAKKDYLKRRGIQDGQTFHFKHNLIPRDLVYALRIYHLSIYDFTDADNALENKIVSVQNEMAMVNTIIELCEDTLDNLKHPLKKDKDKLDTLESTSPLYSAITLRRGEKKIIHSILKLAKMQSEDVQKHWNTRSYEIPTVRDPNV